MLSATDEIANLIYRYDEYVDRGRFEFIPERGKTGAVTKVIANNPKSRGADLYDDILPASRRREARRVDSCGVWRGLRQGARCDR